MAKFLVTGGAGFIGSHLSEQLLLRGDDVVSLDNMDPFYSSAVKERNLAGIRDTAERSGSRFEDVRGDTRDRDLIPDLLKRGGFNGIFHLASLAGVRPSLEDPVRYWDVNCTGTAVILNAAKDAGIKKFVFASSSSVYGNCKTAPFSEDMFVGHPISPYAATKRAGELLCYNYHHLYAINTICIRFFTVYGPRQRPDLAIHKFSRLMLENKPIPVFGDGSTERDYTFITDIVDGTLRAMDYAESCPYDIINLGESATISLRQLIALLEKILGCTAQINRLPMQPGDVTRTWANVSRAADKLGYKPQVTKEEGLRKFSEWLLASPK